MPRRRRVSSRFLLQERSTDRAEPAAAVAAELARPGWSPPEPGLRQAMPMTERAPREGGTLATSIGSFSLRLDAISPVSGLENFARGQRTRTAIETRPRMCARAAHVQVADGRGVARPAE